MQQDSQIAVLRQIIDSFEALKSDCARGLLAKRDIVNVIVESQAAIDVILEPDSTPSRLFKQSHLYGVYTEDDLKRSFAEAPHYTENCREIEDWIGVVLSVVRELAPQNGSSDLRLDLIRELKAQKNLMVTVATGGPRITTVDRNYKERQEWVKATLPSFGSTLR